MANFYVRSTDGNNSDNGSTWALAKQTLAGAASASAAGDTIFVSQSHNYSVSGSISVTFPGTASNPTRVICGSDAAEPPASTADTGKETNINTTATYSFQGSAYCYGLVTELAPTLGAGNLYYMVAGDGGAQVFEKCTSIINTANTSSGVFIGTGSPTVETSFTGKEHTFIFGHASQGLNLLPACSVTLIGGKIDATSAAITDFVAAALSDTVDFTVVGFDFSSAASTLNIIKNAGQASGKVLLRGCKMPSSWSGSLVASGPSNPGFRASMYNCDSADTHYRLLIHTAAGTIRDETTLVRSGGATDGTTSISWKMTTNTTANNTVNPLVSDDMAVWNTSVGSSITVTVEILHDSATNLKDNEVWLEVDYLGTSGVPLTTVTSDKAAVLATAADQATSSVTWTTTGLTNPNKQKLGVTFTPQEYGFIRARVCLGKASYTVYTDSEMTIT